MSRQPSTSSASSHALCPCGRQNAKGQALSYAQCCGRYIEPWEQQSAPDAQALMRSRYTAFVHEDARYLLATWHSSQRPAQLDFEPGAKWLGLQIKAFQVLDAGRAEVEFVARYRVAGRGVRLHERSRFVQEGERWYYVDGEQY